ncbi:MAG: ABC transporter ATP-binding protein [Deltaproteobacteria bacterium]|nr:ABC transporter ATP-binding protein [Deltaproteobacteria bacterium]
MEAIKTEGLSKTYVKGLRQRKVLALNNLSLTVADGEIFGFLGPNGAGKSTTINLLCDLIRPSSGRATILGRDVREPAARRHIGYLPENPSYFGFLTAWELLEFHGKIHGMSAGPIRERGEELLAMLKLIHAAHGQVRTYSKGMVQRVGIAAALIHDPRILIFDEPMSGLDPPGRKLVADLMLEMRDRGKVVFFSTHILHDVEVICDRIGIITDGELQFCGTLPDVISESFDSYEVLLRRAEQEQVAAMEQDGYAPVIFEDKIKVGVPKGDLFAFLASFMQNDMELISIEPKRFSLEDFFMGFVTTHPKE